MRTLHRLTGAASVEIPVPAGKRCRVLSVITDMTGLSLAEQIRLDYTASGALLFRGITTNPTAATTIQFAAALGGPDNPPPLIDNIDPVTGAVTYVIQDTVCCPCADIWFTSQTVVAIAGSGGGLSVEMQLLYEEMPEQ